MSGPGKRKRHSPEQVIAKLREIDTALAGGVSIEDVARQQGVSPATIGRWRTTYGGAKGPEIKRLRELEHENARLKMLVADQALDIQMLKELDRGNY